MYGSFIVRNRITAFKLWQLPLRDPMGRLEDGVIFSKSQPFSAPVITTSRSSPNKNHLGTKILLATLINHPTLIEDVAESLCV